MFRFLFGKVPEDAPVQVVRETQRQTVERALAEINEIVGALDPKPAVTFHPATGAISLALPEQMPDETKALPAFVLSDEALVSETPAPDEAAKAA